jgi:excisionase family DNA binding protein
MRSEDEAPTPSDLDEDGPTAEYIRPVPRIEARAHLAEVIRSAIREELAAISRAPIEQGGGNGTEYLTIARAAEVAGVHPCTIRGWIKDGSLRAYRLGRAYRLLRGDLDMRLTVEAADPTDQQVRERVDAILAKQRTLRPTRGRS